MEQSSTRVKRGSNRGPHCPPRSRPLTTPRRGLAGLAPTPGTELAGTLDRRAGRLVSRGTRCSRPSSRGGHRRPRGDSRSSSSAIRDAARGHGRPSHSRGDGTAVRLRGRWVNARVCAQRTLDNPPRRGCPPRDRRSPAASRSPAVPIGRGDGRGSPGLGGPPRFARGVRRTHAPSARSRDARLSQPRKDARGVDTGPIGQPLNGDVWRRVSRASATFSRVPASTALPSGRGPCRSPSRASCGSADGASRSCAR